MLRIATFNIENLDDKADDKNPSLSERVGVLQKNLKRLSADIICLQEIHGRNYPRTRPVIPNASFLHWIRYYRERPMKIIIALLPSPAMAFPMTNAIW